MLCVTRKVLKTVSGCDSLTWRRHGNSCSPPAGYTCFCIREEGAEVTDEGRGKKDGAGEEKRNVCRKED